MQVVTAANAYGEFAQGAAFVAGGSGAIGAAICRGLAARGSKVVLTYRGNQRKAEEVVEQIRAAGGEAMALQADLENPASIKAAADAAVARFGALHSVVYAAGPALSFLYINQIEPAEWARVMSADVNGCFNLVAAVLPHLREQRRGSLVAVITGAVDRAPPRDIMSAAPKAAIQMLIRGLAREEGRNGIRANCVGPGYIAAGLGLTTMHEGDESYVDRMVRAVPLKRAGTPEDVADVACFLLSDQARYVTGVTIPVAGGLQLA